MWTRNHYKTLEENAYIVEIYKRVKHECTNTYSDEIDSDGEDSEKEMQSLSNFQQFNTN
jgi:hypothetical protein